MLYYIVEKKYPLLITILHEYKRVISNVRHIIVVFYFLFYNNY